MSLLDIVELGSSLIKDGVTLWQGITRLSDEDEADIEPMGDGEIFQSLGVSSLPYPSDDNGRAEGLCARGVAGRDTCFVGARDTRSAEIVGALKPGDTVLHSTGPQQAAQVQCKEDKRQVLMATKDSADKTMLCMLDGSSNKFQLALAGMMLEFDGSDKSITITNGKASILMQGSTIALDGDVILGGTKADPVNKLMVSPMVGAVPLPVAIGAGVATTIVAGGAKGVYVAS